VSGEKPMERSDFDQWKPKDVAKLLALVETERRYYQEILAEVPVSIVIVDPDLHVVSTNRQFRQALGKKNDEITNRPLAEVFPIASVGDLAREASSSLRNVNKIETVWQTGDSSRSITVTAIPARSWQEDSELDVVLVIQDAVPANLPILTPKQSKAVELSTEIDAMLWQADLETGKIVYVNPQAEAMFGHGEAAWLENESLWRDRIAQEDRARVAKFYEHVTASPGDRFAVEFQALRADQSTLQVRESVRVQRDESGKPIRLHGYTTDITQRKELEGQAATAQKSDALNRLSAKLAHDLNNLLMIIAGYGEELKNSVPASNPLHNDMKEILVATERLYTLTTQLQTYTRKPVISAKITSVPTLLNQARTGMERALGNGITLVYEQAPDVAKAKADGAQLEHALTALAHHAYLELGGEGSVTIRTGNVRIRESVGAEAGIDAGDYVHISLTHSGSVMSEEARQRILEPWLYSDESVRDVKMGLAAAYQIVKQSHGDLTVDGVAGVGTTFHIYLPMVSAAELEAERAAAAPVIAPPPVEAPVEPEATLETILVVEDEGGIRALVRKILKRQGYNVLEAAHGEEALRIMREHHGQLDLLLTDVMMPGMNGVELSYKAVEVKPSIRVLFVSGYTDESLLEAGQFPAGTAFLQKPFTLGSLLGKVREVLDSGVARQAAS
jgi:two-component system, cell cycle sensor histidine kinase and response regulator CckA